MSSDPQQAGSEAGPHAEQRTVSFLGRLSGYVASGLRYWEPRRLLYNGVLALVVLGHFLLALPRSMGTLSFDLGLGFFFLAVLANMLYCASYIGDLFFQFSGLERAVDLGRTVLLTVGTAFAAAIAHFFARAMFAG